MSEEHHTPEQVALAFAYAPTILRKLKEAGVELPNLKLYNDASGQLHIGDDPTQEQCDLAINLVRSQRRSMHTEGVAIDFCCGLVTAAEEAAQEREQTLNLFGLPVTIVAGASDDYVLFLHEGRYVGRIDIDLPFEGPES